MRGGVTKAKATAAAVAIAAFALVVPVQHRIDTLRAGLESEHAMPVQLPYSAAVSAALGGFRGIAVDILWIKANAMLDAKQFYQLATYYKVISILQPNFPTVWSFNSWNLAYNVSAEWGRPEEKWRWIKEGLDFAKKGLEYNPDSPDLLLWVGQLYSRKIGREEYFSKRLMETEGVEPFLESTKYYKKAIDVYRDRGELDLNLGRLYARSLFGHGMAQKNMGNIPEAVRYYTLAEKQAMLFLMEFPTDSALAKLIYDIRAEKARYVR